MKLSESFYSVQGEGVTTGVPSYFVRLEGCDLMCGGPQGCLVGKKVENQPCTWWCDSERVWRQGTDITNQQLLENNQVVKS